IGEEGGGAYRRCRQYAAGEQARVRPVEQDRGHALGALAPDVLRCQPPRPAVDDAGYEHASGCPGMRQIPDVLGPRVPPGRHRSRRMRGAWRHSRYGACRKSLRGVLPGRMGFMGRKYLPVNREEPMFLPLDMRSWVPEGDFAWFLVD